MRVLVVGVVKRVVVAIVLVVLAVTQRTQHKAMGLGFAIP
jgi:hypothetical protein